MLNKNLLIKVAILLIIALVVLPHPVEAQGSPVFDDSAPDHLRLSNDYYELTLSKTNGAILTLVDRSTGSNMTRGSRGGCLWGGSFPDSSANYVGGCLYSSAGPNQFDYTWNPTQTTLTLTYTWDPTAGRRVDAVLTLSASTDPFFDLQLALENQWDAVLKNVLLPSDLLFADDSAQGAYGPFLMPGVLLKPGFFQGDYTYVTPYPSDGAFADYLSLKMTGGLLTFYTVNPAPNPIQPVALGFIDDDSYNPDTFYVYHSLHTAISIGQNWLSPLIRVHVGQSPRQTIQVYRQANGIDSYPSLADKLGSNLSIFRQAPLIKADTHRPFLDWISDLDQLPTPALLHPVGFQPRGFDENYPDFLPPDPGWGTTADFRTLVEAAQARGLIVMPYTNPTWWDDESPTVQNLAPLTIADIAVLDKAGQPVYETYNGRGGYVVSPYANFVTQRLAQLMAQWQNEVPVDCVFEDQIGARPWRRDFNPAAINPLVYSDGWLAHTQTYADRCLMTEMGWDRLAKTEVGFHGSLLTWAREFDYANQHWGTGNWEPYPLALWLVSDKVLLYQHDLSLQTMSVDKGVLTWNLAFGTMLSYNWEWASSDPQYYAWFDLATILQRVVVARTAGRLLTGYSELTPNVMQSSFSGVTVLANRHPTLAYPIDGHRVAPGGFLARSTDETMLAGVFTEYFNNRLLAAGEHYVILERTPHVVKIYQPVGSETALTITAPELWQEGKPLYGWVFDRSGSRLGKVDFGLEGSQINFNYTQTRLGQPVGHYEFTDLPTYFVYLPVLIQKD